MQLLVGEVSLFDFRQPGQFDTIGGISGQMFGLDSTRSSDAAMIAAWRDLVSSCRKLHRTVEQVSYRRDTLWAIATAADSTSGGSGCSGTFVPCSPMTISLRQSPSGH